MITPIEGLNAIASVNGNQKVEKPREYDGNFFTSIFQSAIQNVKDTEIGRASCRERVFITV